MGVSLKMLNPFPGQFPLPFQALGEFPQDKSALSAILSLLSQLQMEMLAGMFPSTVLLHLGSTEKRDKASTS